MWKIILRHLRIRVAVERVAKPARRRVRLNLEQLEERDCPAVIHVTTALDFPLATAHTGVTLRDAVSASETHTSVNGSVTGTGTDTIVFDDVHPIVLKTNDTDVAFGPTALVIKDFSPGNSTNITIDGGATGITLDGDNPVILHRLFGIKAGDTLTLNHVALQNGEAKGGNGGNGGGGGAGLGGAIVNFQGTLNINNSTLSGNVAQGGNGGIGSGGGGGAVGGNGGSGSSAGGGGAGVAGNGSDSSGSAGGSGGANETGGIASAGANGSNGGGGGGGSNPASVAGNGTALSSGGFGGGGGGNIGLGSGGAGGFGGGGGDAGAAVFSGGTGGFGGGGSGSGSGFGGAGGFGGASGGFGGGGGGGMGGAVFNNGGTVVVINSTFTGNMAIGGTGATNGNGFGGAIFSRNGNLAMHNDTISGNTANNGGRGVYVLGDGASAATIMDNTIVGQTDSTVTDFVQNTNAGGTVVSGGSNNLIRNQTTFQGTSSNADPKLNGLASNGGPTQTMSLQATSPALNGGKLAVAQSTDQRGVARPQGSQSDIGAFELKRQIAITGGNNQSTTVNTTFANPLTVKVTSPDLGGAPIGGETVTFAVQAVNGAGATITTPATVTTDAGGNASAVVKANGTLGTYTATASISGNAPVVPSDVSGIKFAAAFVGGGFVTFTLTNVAPTPAAASLAFTQQPVTVFAGQTQNVQVTVFDTLGNPATQFNGPVTLQLVDAGGNMTTLAIVNAVNGVATFNNVAVTTAAKGYTLRATVTGLPTATSNPFDILSLFVFGRRRPKH